MRLTSLTLAAALAAAPAAAEDYRTYHTLAESYRARGNLERAEFTQGEAVRLAREQVGPSSVLVVEQLAFLGEIQEMREDWPAAAHSLGAAIGMSRKLNLLKQKGIGIGGKARAAKILRLHGHALERIGKPELAKLSLRRAVEIEKILDGVMKSTLFKEMDFETPLKRPKDRRPLFIYPVRQDDVSGFRSDH